MGVAGVLTNASSREFGVDKALQVTIIKAYDVHTTHRERNLRVTRPVRPRPVLAVRSIFPAVNCL